MTKNKRFKNVEENLEWGTVQYFTYYDEKITDKELEKLVNHLLNQNDELNDENKELRIQYNHIREQSNEFHRIARENANRVGKLEKENEQLKEALKNSYMNEICENCKYGNYFLSDNYDGGFEGDFECLKKHFGNDHWKCDGLTECDEFELEIKGDVE